VAVMTQLCLGVFAGSPALAHAGLQSADPGPGQHVTRLPGQLQLHFGRPTIPAAAVAFRKTNDPGLSNAGRGEGS
jgi:methionine-rich copper-binding protein CopC